MTNSPEAMPNNNGPHAFEPYLDSDGKPIMRLSFCVLADVLGISRATVACQSIEESQDLCTRFLKSLSEFRSYAATTQSLAVFPQSDTFAAFSDLLVLGQAILNPHQAAESELASILLSVKIHQMSMALGGFFVRGGLAIGELHISSKLCFGKALVKSNCLEESAKFPRIIISNGVEALMLHHFTFYADPKEAFHDTELVRDEDGRVFVNYLQASKLGEYTDNEMLKKHKEIIEERLAEFRDDDRIRPKYEWLRDYHNFYCANFYWGFDMDQDGRELISTVCDNELLIEPGSGGTRAFSRVADTADSGGRPSKHKGLAPFIDFTKLSALDDQQFFADDSGSAESSR